MMRGLPTSVFIEASPRDVAYWRSHPLVTAVLELNGGPQPTLLLSIVAADERTEFPRFPWASPDRLPDLHATGEGEAPWQFWLLCPDVEHVAILEDEDASFPNGWWGAKVWFGDRQSPRTAG